MVMPFCVFSFSISASTSFSGATRSLSPCTNRPEEGQGARKVKSNRFAGGAIEDSNGSDPAQTSITDSTLADNTATAAELDAMKNLVVERLEQARGLAQVRKPRAKVPAFSGVWKGLGKAGDDWSAKTGVNREVLARIVQTATNLPV